MLTLAIRPLRTCEGVRVGENVVDGRARGQSFICLLHDHRGRPSALHFTHETSEMIGNNALEGSLKSMWNLPMRGPMS